MTNEITAETTEEYRLVRVFSALAAIGIAVRLVFFLTVPLLESDGLNLILSAFNTLHGGPISLTLTFPSLILVALYKFVGASLWVSTLPNLLADLGTMVLLDRLGKRQGRREIGRAAAALYAVCPLPLLFASIPKPYAQVTFWAFLGILLWERARDDRGAVAFARGAASGLALAAAFAGHTFAAYAAFPLAGFFVAELVGRRFRSCTLAAGLTFGAVVTALILWRFPVYGWSVFNDYPMDWRFDLAVSVWSARWEGLTNLFALSPFVLAAGIGSWARPALRRELTPIDRYLAAVAILGAGMYAFNPVNHFPRVLMPAVPGLCWLAAKGWLVDEARIRARLNFAAIAASFGALWLIIETLANRAVLIGMIHDASPRGFLAVSIAVAAGVALSADRFRRFSARSAAITLAAAACAFGILHAQRAMHRQAETYQSRIEGFLACGRPSDTIGGGDAVHLMLPGPNNYSWLIDLPEQTLQRAYEADVVSVLTSAGLRCVVVDWNDPEGEAAMMAAFTETHDVPAERRRNLFSEIDNDPRVRVEHERGSVVTYALPGWAPFAAGVDSRVQAFSPLVRAPWWPRPFDDRPTAP